MKKRWKLLLLALVSLLVLAGWGQKKVELLSDKKLIDLSAAIGKCTLGADDMTPDEGTGPQNPNGPDVVTPTAAPTPIATPRPTAKPTSSPPPIIVPNAQIIIISIRDEEILYDLRPAEDLDTLKKRITIDNADHVSFKLVDNYAEAHVFRRVMALLEELEAELGIRYIRE